MGSLLPLASCLVLLLVHCLLVPKATSLQMPQTASKLRILCEEAVLCFFMPSTSNEFCICRPAYLALADLRSVFGAVPLAAVTATATPEVMREIKQLLGMRQPQVLSASFNRHNIRYEVRHKELIEDGSDDAVLKV